jgi:hypothetical protein
MHPHIVQTSAGILRAEGWPVPGLEALRSGVDEHGCEWWEYVAPIGAQAGEFADDALVAVVPRSWDGFLNTYLRARAPLHSPQIVCTSPDEACPITPHFRIAPVLAAGAELAIDLEVHPGFLHDGVNDVTIHAHVPTSADDACARPLLVALVPGSVNDCYVTGGHAMSWVDDVRNGIGTPRQLARRIAAVENGKPDPGWGRLHRLGLRRRTSAPRSPLPIRSDRSWHDGRPES